MNILLLYDTDLRNAGTVIDHIDSFSRYSIHDVFPLRNVGDLPRNLDLRRFDALVIHYSLVMCQDYFLSPTAKTQISSFRGIKAALIQDEYRFVDASVSVMRELGITLLFTCVPQREWDRVYPVSRLPGVRKVQVLTGYVPEASSKIDVPPYSHRPIDIGYRARTLPAWLGELGQEKWRIGERFLRDAKGYDLNCDIAWDEGSRIYGDKWIRFITSTRAVLGTESGSSICDFTGEIQRNVESHLQKHPETPYEKLRDLYFKDVDGKIVINVISPRCFEAAALRTLMIMYPGEYSGILEPWKHYIPLEKDHSNMAEVIAAMRDAVVAERIVTCAYQEIALNPEYSYDAFVRKFDNVLRELRGALDRIHSPYSSKEFSALVRNHRWSLFRRKAPYQFVTFVHHVLLGVLLRFAPVHVRARVTSFLRRSWRAVRTNTARFRARKN